ncbi:hypothetical protein EVAR_53750_1 [Eumeta japonica]|uniref:Uncharacterized protein n=1 Tax=Eumeta variegata TaxID=151549 RepID=A0A4C1ZAC4_EUMVA|nr:hypothetical protein EVAR_53750_1 [Eumeta japonica]
MIKARFQPRIFRENLADRVNEQCHNCHPCLVPPSMLTEHEYRSEQMQLPDAKQLCQRNHSEVAAYEKNSLESVLKIHDGLALGQLTVVRHIARKAQPVAYDAQSLMVVSRLLHRAKREARPGEKRLNKRMRNKLRDPFKRGGGLQITTIGPRRCNAGGGGLSLRHVLKGISVLYTSYTQIMARSSLLNTLDTQVATHQEHVPLTGTDVSRMAQCLVNTAGAVVFPNQVFLNSFSPEPLHADEH